MLLVYVYTRFSVRLKIIIYYLKVDFWPRSGQMTLNSTEFFRLNLDPPTRSIRVKQTDRTIDLRRLTPRSNFTHDWKKFNEACSVLVPTSNARELVKGTTWLFMAYFKCCLKQRLVCIKMLRWGFHWPNWNFLDVMHVSGHRPKSCICYLFRRKPPWQWTKISKSRWTLIYRKLTVRYVQMFSFLFENNLVPRASFPLTSGRKTRALGASISGMRHSMP